MIYLWMVFFFLCLGLEELYIEIQLCCYGDELVVKGGEVIECVVVGIYVGDVGVVMGVEGIVVVVGCQSYVCQCEEREKLFYGELCGLGEFEVCLEVMVL